MSLNRNWEEVEENKEYEKLVPGGYICGIKTVEDVPEKEYLKVFYEIVDGKFKNYFKGLYEAKKFWGGTFIRSYKEKAAPFFKGFLTAIEKSNPAFMANKFSGNIKELERKYIGVVLGEEEYYSTSGELKTRLYVAELRSVDSIKLNEFKVPTLKKAKEQPAFANVSSFSNDSSLGFNEDELPF